MSNIQLNKIALCNKEKFYQWATNSDATPYWYGSLYGDNIPTREELFEDYDADYFNEKKPCEKGVFAIKPLSEDREIGVVNYQVEWISSKKYYDIDILIASDQDKNKGYGSAALSSLVRKLNVECNAEYFMIHVHSENTRAQKAYEKAGFIQNRKYKDAKGFEWLEYTKGI